MTRTEHFTKVEIASSDELRAWLLEHHGQSESVWLVTFKKNPETSEHEGKFVSRDAVLDELISFGWIDGVRRKIDADRTMQLIGPRRVQHWAKTYKDRAATLIASGQMHSAGLAAIEESKQNGMWDLMNDVDALIAPDDLCDALDKKPPARDNYEAFPPSTKRNTLRWIKIAKTDATRAKRIATTVDLAVKNERVPNA
ncbi:MAG: hypothetical protein HKN94_01485 [Acidimicrobiales bacterium]|nr:hypothetical protein [Acidimicrobiales bacterium]RZV42246.1 MAG: hypothetical protein EX269_15160 [Acidimicrobiales bacterium]